MKIKRRDALEVGRQVFRPQFDLKDQKGGVEVSTVSLPDIAGGGYETCIFKKGEESEVVERYKNAIDAARGHVHYCNEHGIKIQIIDEKKS